MQILSKFCHNKHLTRKMAPHTITHCINDDTSFLRESRDIKYHYYIYIYINSILNFYASQSVCLDKLLSNLPKNYWIISTYSSTSKNV